MKCDSCKNMASEAANMGYPYPAAWCAKGHWEGSGDFPEPEIDPWRDCKDFAPEEQESSDGG